jgi:hypothetical protein
LIFLPVFCHAKPTDKIERELKLAGFCSLAQSSMSTHRGWSVKSDHPRKGEFQNIAIKHSSSLATTAFDLDLHAAVGNIAVVSVPISPAATHTTGTTPIRESFISLTRKKYTGVDIIARNRAR